MKFSIVGFVISIVALALAVFATLHENKPVVKDVSAEMVQVKGLFYSPNGGVTNGVVQELGTAKSTVRVLAYGMTSKPIANALVEAKKRGVDVQVVLDYKENYNQKSSEATVLQEGNIPVLYDKKHNIAHNKVMIIDGKDVITGSFNFTTAAETNNAENLIILNSPDLAKTYTTNWQLHHDHSVAN